MAVAKLAAKGKGKEIVAPGPNGRGGSTIKWKYYKVVLGVTNEFMGGVPKNPELIRDWLAAKKAPNLEKNAEEIEATIEPTEERVSCGFQSIDGLGLCIRGYHMKSHLKDIANVLREVLPKGRTRAGQPKIIPWRSVVANHCFVLEDYIPLGKSKPDGNFEHPIHVDSPQGPRSALKSNDFVMKPRIKFMLRVLDAGLVTEQVLLDLFDYGGIHGTGAERGIAFGRYKLVELKEMV